MSSVRSESGTAYLIFQKASDERMYESKKQYYIRSGMDREDDKNQRNRVKKSVRFLFFTDFEFICST